MWYTNQSSDFKRIALKRGTSMSDTEVKESQLAPDFTLAAIGPQDVVKNDQIHLSDLRGKAIVLYFYPKED